MAARHFDDLVDEAFNFLQPPGVVLTLVRSPGELPAATDQLGRMFHYDGLGQSEHIVVP
jgi:hypothetical protein